MSGFFARAQLRLKAPWLLISLVVLALDQWSKWMIETHLPLYMSTPVIPGLLNLTHVRNSGVAFGLFAAGGDSTGVLILTALGLTALGVVGYYFASVGPGDRLLLAALSLVLGGAVGNLLDRAASGAVTDFIDVYYKSYHFYSFNVADSAISVGICLMLIATYLPQSERPEESAHEAAKAPSP